MMKKLSTLKTKVRQVDSARYTCTMVENKRDRPKGYTFVLLEPDFLQAFL